MTAAVSRCPAQKIGDQPQTQFLAFFRVKLCADNVVASDKRGDGAAVIGFGDDSRPIGSAQMERVYEVSVHPVVTRCDAVE